MCHDHASDQRDEQIIDDPGIGGGLDHDRIGGVQIGRCPIRPAMQFDTTRREHDALVGIDAADHQIVFVDVDGDLAGPGLKWRVGHGTLLCILYLNAGARIFGLNGSNTDTSVTR
jgi:hypothetical protein